MSPITTDAAFIPVRTRRIYQEICNQVRHRLAVGQLRPGDKLPAERELAIELGVSRAAVREALRALENAGVVALRSGSRGGAFIRHGDASSLAQPLGDLMALGQLSPDGLLDARLQINETTARQACGRRTQEDLDALARYLDDVDAASETAAGRARTLFLRRIASAGGNPLWSALVESLETLSLTREDSPPVHAAALQRVLRAVQRRQPGEARKAMREALAPHLAAPAVH